MICRSRCTSDAAVKRYVKTTIAIDPTTNSVEYQRASRSPNVRVNGGSRAEDIPDTADGLQQLLLERPIDLLAQAAHEHVDDVRLRIEAVLPHMREDHRLRHDFAGVAHQVLQESELPRPQIDRDAAAGDAPRQQIEHQIIY